MRIATEREPVSEPSTSQPHTIRPVAPHGDVHAAEELRARLAAIVECSDDAIIAKTLDGTITDWNAAAERLYGYTAAEATGRSIAILVPPNRRDEHREIMERLRRGEHIEPFDTQRRCKDGKIVDVSVTTSLIRAQNGRTIGVSTIARDVTERRRVEARRIEALEAEREARRLAEEALRIRDEFLSVASHELRTPLTSLQLQVQMLERYALQGREDALTPKRVLGQVTVLLRQTQRLGKLVNDLLDVTRITAGRLTMQCEEVDLVAITQEVIERFEGGAALGGSKVVVPAQDPVVGWWDSQRLDQVVTNLLTNAVKYGQGKDIEITVKRSGGKAQLMVRDHGLGIPGEALTRIFDRFERAAPVLNYGGLGLGLYITRQIVEAHGGTISVSSTPGSGSTFVVDLPVGEDRT